MRTPSTLRPAPALPRRRFRRAYRPEPVAALEPRRLLAAVNWDGGGNGVDWTDPLNWSTNALPGPNDDVTIDIAASPNVRLSSGNQSVRSFVIRENFALQNGTLQTAQPSSFQAPFSFSNGTLTGAGAVTISGAFTWSDGTMDGGGTTAIAGGTTATFSGGGNKRINNRTINVSGTVNHIQGNLLFSASAASAGTLNILSGGVYNAQDEADLTHFQSGGTNTVNVQAGGTFNKTGTGTTQINTQVAFVNNGTAVNVDSGNLLFSGMLNNSRPLAVDAGATLFNEGTATFAAGTTFPGPGLVHLRAGTHTFSAAASLPNALLTNGTLNGSATVSFTGAFTWTDGTMDGGGISAIGAGATATFSGGGNKRINNRTVSVAGTVTHTQGNLLFSASAASASTLNILSGGVYNAQDEADLSHFVSGGTNTVNLQAGGTFNKTGTGNTQINNQVVFNNNGTAVNVDSGSLLFSGMLNNARPLAVDAGATLFNDGTATFAAGTAFPGPGLVHLRAGTHTFSAATSLPNAMFTNGTLNGNATVSFTGAFTWTDGTMDGGGITTIPAGAAATFSGGGNKRINNRTVSVSGTVTHTQGNLLFSASAASASTLNILSGGVYNAQDEADLSHFVSGGTNTVNLQAGGTFNKTGTGNTQINNQVVFNNNGTAVNVDSGSLLFSGMLNNARPLAVDAGATLFNDGTATFAAGTAFPGPGLVHLRAGTHTFSAATSLPNAMFTNGTLNGNAAVTFSGAFIWTDGTMDGGGISAIGAGATATFSSGGNKRINNRTVSVSGTVTHTQGNLLFSASAASASTLNILSGGVYNAQDEADLSHFVSGGTNTVNLQAGGTFNKTGTGNTQISNQVTFNNTGTANVNSGTLNPVVITQVSGNTLTGGTWNVADGATLLFPAATQIRQNAGSVSLTGPGSVFAAINALRTNDGMFKLAGARDLAVTPDNGTFANNGTLDLGPGSDLTVTGGFGNAPVGTFITRGSGNDAATHFGRISSTAVAFFAGTLTADLVGAFDPALDNTFTVASGSSKAGTFVTFNDDVSPGGRRLGLAYTGSSAFLTVRPRTPSVPDLADSSDNGPSNTDDTTNDATPTFTGTADPGTTVRLLADDVEVGSAVADAAGNWAVTASTLAAGNRFMTATATDPQNDVSPESGGNPIRIDVTTATVNAVFVDGTAWTPAFRQFLQTNGLGSSTLGFSIAGGAAQLDELPWMNVNRLHVQFSEDVSVQQADLAVRGINMANYPLGPAANFTYDAATFTASWTFGGAVALINDKVLLDLDGDVNATAVTDIAGNQLDGNWTNGSDTFPSGNGVPGGDFRFQIHSLPGDLNRNGGVVNSIDVQSARLRQFTSTTTPGTPPNTYTAFHDINGSGNINSIDVQLTRIRQFSGLPDGNPTLRGSLPSFGALGTNRVGRALAAEELESLIG